MKFDIDAKTFAQEIREAMAFTQNKGVQAQRSVLLTVMDDTLEVRAKSNAVAPFRQMAFVSTVPVSGHEDGYAIVPARQLYDIIAQYPAGETEFRSTEKNLIIKQGEIRFQLRLLDIKPADMTVDFPDEAAFSPLMEGFSEAIRKVSYAANRGDVRDVFRSVCFDYTDDNLYVCSMDGRRLSSKMFHIHGKGQTRVPVEFADAMARRDVDSFCEKDGLAFFRKGDRYYATSTYTSSYPAWRRIVPPKTDSEVIKVDRCALIDAVTRVALTADDKSCMIKLEAKDDKLTLSSISSVGSCTETIDCRCGEPMCKYVRHQFLMDVLTSSSSKEVEMHYGKSDNRAMLITDEDPDFKAVVCYITPAAGTAC